jgi:hypothetical protein
MKTLKLNRVTKLWLVGLFFIVGLGNGCSTPAVPTTDTDPPETAWWAYQDCLDNLPRSSSPTLCNNVGTTRGQSPQSYSSGNLGNNVGPYPTTAYPQTATPSAGYPAAGSTGPMSLHSSSNKAARAPSDQSSAVQFGNALAYHEYLKTLDEKTLSEMTAQWKSLSDQTAVE